MEHMLHVYACTCLRPRYALRMLTHTTLRSSFGVLRGRNEKTDESCISWECTAQRPAVVVQCTPQRALTLQARAESGSQGHSQVHERVTLTTEIGEKTEGRRAETRVPDAKFHIPLTTVVYTRTCLHPTKDVELGAVRAAAARAFLRKHVHACACGSSTCVHGNYTCAAVHVRVVLELWKMVEARMADVAELRHDMAEPTPDLCQARQSRLHGSLGTHRRHAESGCPVWRISGSGVTASGV